MFKFVFSIVVLLHLCHMMASAAPNPSQALYSIHKKSVSKNKGPGSAENDARCEVMEKEAMARKKNKKKGTEDEVLADEMSRMTMIPETSRQSLVARLVCSLKRSQCTAYYNTCIQLGVGCNTCWDLCQDLRECAVALGRDYASWAQEGEGNRFECQQECGCIFDIDL